MSSHVGMTTDFSDAADRHFHDGELLRTHRRWANADHLFGFATECALKAIMLGLGAKQKHGVPEGKRQHIDIFWHTLRRFC